MRVAAGEPTFPEFGKTSTALRQPTREPPRQATTCSAPLCPLNVLPKLVFQHWGIEYQLHDRLDVLMNDEQRCKRLDNSPWKLAILRHMALNVRHKDATKKPSRGKFQPAARDTYLARLLCPF
jgi:hypothetical protein